MNIFKLLENVSKMDTSGLEADMANLLSFYPRLENQETLDDIQSRLTELSGCKCESVVIGRSGDGNQLYGMRVYPSTDAINKMAAKLLQSKSTSQFVNYVIHDDISFVVELDPQLFSGFIRFTPKEIVAMLLHEVGHVTTNSDFYAEMKKSMDLALLEMDKNKDVSLNKNTIAVVMLYIMRGIDATRIQNISKDQLQKEKLADKYVYDLGLGEDLYSALNKFNKLYLNYYRKCTRDEKLNQQAKETVAILGMLKNRAGEIKILLDADYKLTKSHSIKDTIKYIQRSLTSLFNNTQKPLVVINEGFLDLWMKNPVKVSQADIDSLLIEIDRMEDYDDKEIVVYKIHKRLQQLADAQLKIARMSEPNDIKTFTVRVESYSKQLQSMLKDALKFKPTPKRYGVFIKYPKGYEG